MKYYLVKTYNGEIDITNDLGREIYKNFVTLPDIYIQTNNGSLFHVASSISMFLKIARLILADIMIESFPDEEYKLLLGRSLFVSDTLEFEDVLWRIKNGLSSNT